MANKPNPREAKKLALAENTMILGKILESHLDLTSKFGGPVTAVTSRRGNAILATVAYDAGRTLGFCRVQVKITLSGLTPLVVQMPAEHLLEEAGVVLDTSKPKPLALFEAVLLLANSQKALDDLIDEG